MNGQIHILSTIHSRQACTEQSYGSVNLTGFDGIDFKPSEIRITATELS